MELLKPHYKVIRSAERMDEIKYAKIFDNQYIILVYTCFLLSRMSFGSVLLGGHHVRC